MTGYNRLSPPHRTLLDRPPVAGSKNVAEASRRRASVQQEILVQQSVQRAGQWCLRRWVRALERYREAITALLNTARSAAKK